MDAIELICAQKRMCIKYHQCKGCPLNGICVVNVDTGYSKDEMEKHIAIVEQWAAEHPQETRWTKLKKQYPKIADSDKYEICARALGYECKDCENTDCKDCWDEPVDNEEEQK